MENEKFITLLTAVFGSEIAVIQSRLESEGITCFLKDELMAQIYPFYSNAIGGVKLQVRESDFNRAVEILKETGYIEDKDLQPSNEQPHLNDYSNKQQNANDRVEIVCPVCGSEEVTQTKKAGWLFLLTSFLIGTATPFLQKKYYCFDCKQEFKALKK